MVAKKKKMKFYVQEDETIGQCLDRMASEGYTPVRRMEEPVLQEVKKGGETTVEVFRQRVVFEGKLITND